MRRSEDSENLEDLVDLAVSHEQRPLLQHLGENAAGTPDVDAERVVLRAQENLGASVPERHDLMRIRFDRETERSRKAKVCQLDGLAV